MVFLDPFLRENLQLKIIASFALILIYNMYNQLL